MTREQAQQVSPQAVQALAEHAVKKDPTIVQRASEFYAQHPTLVKTVGATALAVLVARMMSMRR